MLVLATLTLFLAACHGRHVDIPNCDGIIIRNINHDKEVLKENINLPYQLALDYDSQTLFFSYHSSGFKSAYLNLKTNEYNTIKNIPGGFANTVDNKTHTVYLGSKEGIYGFDFETKSAINLNICHQNIWKLYYAMDTLYYVTFPDQKLYSYKDGRITLVPELANTKVLFAAVDQNQNIFFSNSSGLYCYKKVKESVVFIGNYEPNCFTTDKDGRIYFSTSEGIYSINHERNTIENLARIPNLYGMVVESNGNIIYAIQNALLRLTPSKTKCYIEKENVKKGNEQDE